MSCPTCDHTMNALGCNTTGRNWFTCPRCGTIKTCDGVLIVPALVERCREFEEKVVAEVPFYYREQWRQYSIAESIHTPDFRLKR